MIRLLLLLLISGSLFAVDPPPASGASAIADGYNIKNYQHVEAQGIRWLCEADITCTSQVITVNIKWWQCNTSWVPTTPISGSAFTQTFQDAAIPGGMNSYIQQAEAYGTQYTPPRDCVKTTANSIISLYYVMVANCQDTDPGNDIPYQPGDDLLDDNGDPWNGTGTPPWDNGPGDPGGNDDPGNWQPIDIDTGDGDGDDGGNTDCTPKDIIGKSLPRPTLPGTSFAQIHLPELQSHLVAEGLSDTSSLFITSFRGLGSCDTFVALNAVKNADITHQGQTVDSYTIKQWRAYQKADGWQHIDLKTRE